MQAQKAPPDKVRCQSRDLGLGRSYAGCVLIPSTERKAALLAGCVAATATGCLLLNLHFADRAHSARQPAEIVSPHLRGATSLIHETAVEMQFLVLIVTWLGIALLASLLFWLMHRGIHRSRQQLEAALLKVSAGQPFPETQDLQDFRSIADTSPEFARQT